MRLARSTWPAVREYFESNDTVVIAVGSIEDHGRQNPLGTDAMAPDRLLDLIEERDPDVLIAPTLPYGATDDLVGFPGTVSLGVDCLVDVMTHITDCLRSYGARRFVFLNGHGGNVKPLTTVAMALNRAGNLAALLNWWRIAPQLNPAWGGGHGGAMETSANLAIDPDSVDLSQVADECLRDDVSPEMRSVGWYKVRFDGVDVDMPRDLVRFASNGWVAEGFEDHPAHSSAQLGREMLQGTAQYVVKFIDALRRAPLPEPLDAARELRAADEDVARRGSASGLAIDPGAARA
jgi:creatinine amidohydrolase